VAKFTPKIGVQKGSKIGVQKRPKSPKSRLKQGGESRFFFAKNTNKDQSNRRHEESDTIQVDCLSKHSKSHLKVAIATLQLLVGPNPSPQSSSLSQSYERSPTRVIPAPEMPFKMEVPNGTGTPKS
jgi:hypothetical protein